jgi:hypothetical protein
MQKLLLAYFSVINILIEILNKTMTAVIQVFP